MQAITVTAFGGPEVLQVAEKEIPTPGPGQVLVKVQAVGINPVETYIRSGTYAILPPLPWVPGTDGSGTVEAVGDKDSSLEVSSRVWLSGSLTGTYAQYALADASKVHPLPENVSFDQGASLGVPFLTAYHALHHIGRPKETDPSRPLTILIHGASGGCGVAALQLAKKLPNAFVIGTAGSKAGLALILENGASLALNHTEEDYLAEIKTATEGRGVDIVLEMLANVNLAKDCSVLAIGGRVCVIGNRGTLEFNPRDLMARRAEVRGVALALATTAEREEMTKEITSGLADGSLKPIVGKTYPLASAPQSHSDVMAQPGGATGKLVLHPWE